jgi:hypothetical protein
MEKRPGQREWEDDVRRRNDIRSGDYRMLKELIWERRITMTERARMQHLEHCLGDIVAHYVLTDAEREEVRALLERPGEVPTAKGLTERVLESVFQYRARQEAEHGGPMHDREHSSRDWISFAVKQLGKAEHEPFSHDAFHSAMLEVASVAVAAAEWSERTVAEREAEKRVPDPRS